MIKVENTLVSNMHNAIRGMRNPLESWADSDSQVTYACVSTEPPYTGLKAKTVSLKEYSLYNDYAILDFALGENDKALALKLIKAGTDHSKFMRQIFVSMDITAPMTWWWDFDTYKVGTTKNSTSRMHKLGSRNLDINDFGWSQEGGTWSDIDMARNQTITMLNNRIDTWRKLKAKPNKTEEELRIAPLLWRSIIDDLPQSYMFRATWTGNYQVLRAVYKSREGHKQTEFDDLRSIMTSLPYNELITQP